MRDFHHMSQKGFTLLELVSVIIILGVISAIAVPRYYDYKTQAELTMIKSTLANVRSAINNFYLNKALTEDEPRYPTLAELTTPGTVIKETMPDNPKNGGNNIIGEGVAPRQLKHPNTYGWGYRSDSGTFWANTEDLNNL